MISLEFSPVPGYRVRSEATWAAAREAYDAGAPAAEVCARFDLGLSALRTRARNEGWRRLDQPDPAPEGDDAAEMLDDDPELTPAELAELAWKRARRAILRGRLREAQGWTRLHRDWRALAEAAARRERATVGRIDEAERERSLAQTEAVVGALITAANRSAPVAEPVADPGEQDGLHALHHDLDVQTPERILNRAERRKRARLDAWTARQSARGP